MIEPLQISLDLACPAAHAFRVYTERASAWFPVEHTMTRVPGLAVVFEPHVGETRPTCDAEIHFEIVICEF